MLWKISLITFAIFCFLHIYRDILQIKKGYNYSWFTRIGHVWHRPQYEKHGMVVFFLLGVGSVVIAFRL